MKKNALNWFDRMMIDVTFAEAGVAEPDLSHIKQEDTKKLSSSNKKEEGSGPFDGEVVPVQ